MGNAAAALGQEPKKEPEVAQAQEESHANSFLASFATKGKPKTCCKILRAIYVILSVITILKCIAVIIATVTTAIATRTFSLHQSGRLIAMILLAVSAAVAMSMVIYAMMGVIRKKTDPLHITAVVLIILAIIQSIICGVSVNMTSLDEINLSRALEESFNMAREENPKHVKLWATTQSDLNCCGVYGSEDYRNRNMPLYFPPDVPISCCPTYDPLRSPLVQERERESCKARREYYDMGCRTPVVTLFRYTASLVLVIVSMLIFSEVGLALLGIIITWKQKRKDERENPENK